MNRPDIEALAARLENGFYFDIRATADLHLAVAYIRFLEKDKARLDWLGSGNSSVAQPISHHDGGWTWAWNEGYYLGDKDFETFREAIDYAMNKEGK